MNPEPHDQPVELSHDPSLPDAVGMAKRVVAGILRPGDVAIDATVGNGHDTLWLARLVGEHGLVIGCDRQEVAIAATRKRLQSASVLPRTRLLQLNHADLAETISVAERQRVRAVMFNLGYLPGSDKTMITTPETTLRALRSMRPWLPPGAVVTVVVYPGHPGGTAERDAVLNWTTQLDPDEWRTQLWRALNRQRPAPELIALQRFHE